MKLTQIEYFLKVAEKLNYTTASRELYISQPALSKQISLLEENLGVQLLRRDNKHVELTAAGKKLQAEMDPLLRQMNTVIEQVRAMNDHEGHIRIGCFDGLNTNSLLDDIEKRLKAFGVHTVDINLYDTKELKERLQSGDLDLGLILEFSLPCFEDFYWQTLECRQGAVIYSRQHPLAQKAHITAADFSEYIFMSPDDTMTPGAMSQMCKNLELCHIRPREIIAVPNIMTLASNIDRGLALAVLSRDVVESKNGTWLVWDLPAAPLHILGIAHKTHKNRTIQKLFQSYEHVQLP